MAKGNLSWECKSDLSFGNQSVQHTVFTKKGTKNMIISIDAVGYLTQFSAHDDENST